MTLTRERECPDCNIHVRTHVKSQLCFDAIRSALQWWSVRLNNFLPRFQLFVISPHLMIKSPLDSIKWSRRVFFMYRLNRVGLLSGSSHVTAASRHGREMSVARFFEGPDSSMLITCSVFTLDRILRFAHRQKTLQQQTRHWIHHTCKCTCTCLR